MTDARYETIDPEDVQVGDEVRIEGYDSQGSYYAGSSWYPIRDLVPETRLRLGAGAGVVTRHSIVAARRRLPELKNNDPLSGIDAREWAKEFMRIWSGRWSEVDEGLMISWFANAIMRGFDEARRRTVEEATPKPEPEPPKPGTWNCINLGPHNEACRVMRATGWSPDTRKGERRGR